MQIKLIFIPRASLNERAPPCLFLTPPVGLCLQPHPRVSEAGPGRQRVFQPLQAGEEAQQAAGFSRRADSHGAVSPSGRLLFQRNLNQPNYQTELRFLSFPAIRYQEAIDRYESVMKTEPNVAYYTNLAKERICFCLVKVWQRTWTLLHRCTHQTFIPNPPSTPDLSVLPPVDKDGPWRDRRVLRSSPERPTKCQHPSWPSWGLHPEPGLWERFFLFLVFCSCDI